LSPKIPLSPSTRERARDRGRIRQYPLAYMKDCGKKRKE
jgi:hypothetical protein